MSLAANLKQPDSTSTSLFFEYSNLSGDGVAAAGQDTDEAGFAIGTSVSF